MFKCNILIFNFCTLLTKSTNQPTHEPTSTTNQPAPRTNQHHEPTSTTNQPAPRTNQHTNQPAHEPTSTRTNQHTNQPAHEPTSKARTNRKTDTTRHKKQSAGYLYRKIKNSSFFSGFISKNKC